ncbi:MAG: ATP-binding cassette domain-containing protein [Bacteroidales bacterium]|nr:ATP-binding cassette domain-containing protein [Bacteroidales bacterium]
MNNFLKVENISKQFENHKALDNVTFGVNEGKIFGLLGPNGAGKTTLIRIINRIFEPDTGQVFINSEKLKADHIAQIGYLPEERGMYKKMKVGEQIIYFAQLKGLTKQQATEQANFWLKRLDATDWWNKKVEELSKGMQQKIQFIITVLHKPKLLIFDEPFTGFDPINVDLIKKQILWLRDQGTTIIFSTHNMASVEEICEDIVLINKSRKVLEGNLAEIKKQFSTNTFEVAFNTVDEGFKSNEVFDIVDEVNEKEIKTFKVKLKKSSSKEFLKYASEHGNVVAFNELIPSLHDIFVKVVTNSENPTENE